MPTVEVSLDPRFSTGILPSLTPAIRTGVFVVPVQGQTFTTANQYAAFSDGAAQSVVGFSVLEPPVNMTITRISARLATALTGAGTVDVGIYDFDGTGAFNEDVFARITVGNATATGTGTFVLAQGSRYGLNFRRTGGSTVSINPTSVIIEYTVDADDGYVIGVRDGSVTSGSPITQFFPTLFQGGLSASNGVLAATSNQKVALVPDATSLLRMTVSSTTIPASTATFQNTLGGTLTDATVALPSAGPMFAYNSVDLAPLAMPACAIVADVTANYLTQRLTTPAGATVHPSFLYAYQVPSVFARQWVGQGWALRLGSNATVYEGFSGNTTNVTQNNMQALWTTAGRFTKLLLVILPENTSADKTYEYHLEVDGSSVFSTTFTNNAATIVDVSSLSIPVVAGSLVNTRLQMNGGFTASRRLNMLAVFGFEAD